VWAIEQTNVHPPLAPREGWSCGCSNTYGNYYLLWSLRAVDMMMAPIQFITPMKQKIFIASSNHSKVGNQQLLVEARAGTGVNAVVVVVVLGVWLQDVDYLRYYNLRIPTVRWIRTCDGRTSTIVGRMDRPRALATLLRSIVRYASTTTLSYCGLPTVFLGTTVNTCSSINL